MIFLTDMAQSDSDIFARFLPGSIDHLPRHLGGTPDPPSTKSLAPIFFGPLRHGLEPIAFVLRRWWQSHPVEYSAFG
jgi:hypothetical protein